MTYMIGNKPILLKLERLLNERNFRYSVVKTKKNQSLTKLRNTLLPQLISGKLSVPVAMLEVEKGNK